MRGAEAGEQGSRQTGNNPIAGSTSSAPHSGSEKYGSWMLVSHKDRRNRFRGTNQQAYGPPIDRRQGTPTGLASDFEGLGTQSRFATLESLDEANLELGEENMPRNDALHHPEEALPRIRTKAKDVQRSPALGNSGSHRVVPMLLTREDMLPIPGVGIRVFIKVADSLGIEVDNSQLIAETELTTVAGLEHSLKEDPPDAGTSGGDRNVDDDIAMMEGDGPGVPLDELGNIHAAAKLGRLPALNKNVR
nr:uncharacterized protein LOC109171840 [Ipomoea batatas]